MKTFQMSNDENRIYFQNKERKPAEKEFQDVIESLKRIGCEIGEKQPKGLDDIYDCKTDGMSFKTIYTGDETFIYSENKETIKKIIDKLEK